MRVASVMRRQGLARRRAFDVDEAVRASSRVFHELGYAGCSLADLERATGVSRMSLYNAIGDKEAIFMAVLEADSREFTQRVAIALNENTLDSLIAFFSRQFAPDDVEADGRSLLLLVAALEREAQSRRIRSHLAACRGRVVDIIRNLLESEKARGRLAPEVSPAAAAEFLVMTFWGFSATARVYDDVAALNAPMQVLLQTIESWRARAGG